jgi:hypothetical protein
VTSTIEGNHFVGSLLKPLLKRVILLWAQECCERNVYGYCQSCWLYSIAHGDWCILQLAAQGKNLPGGIRRPSAFSSLPCNIKGTGMPCLRHAWVQCSTIVYFPNQRNGNQGSFFGVRVSFLASESGSLHKYTNQS